MTTKRKAEQKVLRYQQNRNKRVQWSLVFYLLTVNETVIRSDRENSFIVEHELLLLLEGFSYLSLTFYRLHP